VPPTVEELGTVYSERLGSEPEPLPQPGPGGTDHVYEEIGLRLGLGNGYGELVDSSSLYIFRAGF
jgi:hypothetical protein